MSSSPALLKYAETPTAGALQRRHASVSGDLLVLTRDESLIHALKAVQPSHEVLSVGSESDLTGALLGARVGVAVLDAGLVKSSIGELAENLRAQFPDLVLIVAGRLNDQSLLASQITSGTIYRFLHKPVSEQRVRLFVEAAWRRHEEESSGGAHSTPAAASAAEMRTPVSRKVLAVGAVLLSALLLAGAWWATRSSDRTVDTSRERPGTSAALSASFSDPEQQDLLNRADRAIEASTASAASLANAATLYRKALQRNGSDARARAGVERVIDKLLSAAEAQLAARHLDEAQKLAEQARSIKPEHLRVAFLMAQIIKARERAVGIPARPVAAPPSTAPPAAAIPTSVTIPGALTSTGASRAVTSTTPSTADTAAATAVGPSVGTTTPATADPLAPSTASPVMPNTSPTAASPLPAAETTPPPTPGAASAATAGTPSTETTQITATTPSTAMTPSTAATIPAGAAVAPQISPTTADVDGARNTRPAGAAQQQEFVAATSLVLTRYAAPIFPAAARERGISGWVDLQFVVKKDGSVADVVVIGAEPSGVFDQTALGAVRKWRYKPVLRSGFPIDQATRLHMRFALQN